MGPPLTFRDSRVISLAIYEQVYTNKYITQYEGCNAIRGDGKAATMQALKPTTYRRPAETDAGRS